MDEPLVLFETAPLIVDAEPSHSIQESFEAFHAANPWVYDALVKLTRDMLNRGHRRVGIKALFEVLRWHYIREVGPNGPDFKLNNKYTSRYARLIIEREPELAHAFEVRKLRAA